MGVPKFYRWISERYPCLSETIKEFQIPEFDNLYLDMNGIIHVCSHPDDDNPHFRITEEKIFNDIAYYLEFLFRMIKPRKVFFMAVDGVAPRAKMNQQRGRRFRAARTAEDLEKQAKMKGEVLPTEERFDSNCITPGTEFMVRLNDHLREFVVRKVSTDPLWHGVRVYLSGHETPGEGEHKLMDFIRHEKSQPGYDHNTRHCLYGLDADLMMLGLTSHEPHFSLLREEVRFGGRKDANKRPATPEETTFHLLHLSLMREYLEYEFAPLKRTLPFPYDLEHIIDDWVLMGFLVGNDFIPHLPHLHIQHDALPLLWKTYMKVLPTCGGYINEGGYLNLERFEKYVQALAQFDIDTFNEQYVDLKWMESKIGDKSINEDAGRGAELQLKEKQAAQTPTESNHYPDLIDLKEANGIKTERLVNIDDEDSSWTDMTPDTDEDTDTFTTEFLLHKKNYYQTKLDYEKVTREVLMEQARGYVTAIQWILLYYYEGVPSWGWFYPHHYAPYISDVKDFKDMTIEFDFGQPFLPFQQLMAVLPAASKKLLPREYQKLMETDESPVKEFYPLEFSTDLNGKLQEWEAVVLIPFINEERLLDAMQPLNQLLSKSEKARNRHGPHMLYEYVPENLGTFTTDAQGVATNHNNHARLTELHKFHFKLPSEQLYKGLQPDVRLDVYFPGFPTLKHIKHKVKHKKDGVKVFQMNSRGENMILEIISPPEPPSLEDVAKEYLGKTIFVGWPHMHEAKVISLANAIEKYTFMEEVKKGSSTKVLNVKQEELSERDGAIVMREASSIAERYHDRLGIVTGPTAIVVYACPMSGRKYVCGTHGMITLEKQFTIRPIAFAYQATVKDITSHDPDFTQFRTLDALFPPETMVFMLGWPHYGAQGEVLEVDMEKGRVRICVVTLDDIGFEDIIRKEKSLAMQYFPGFIAAQRLGISSHLVSRVTGGIWVQSGAREENKKERVNLGLNLKFTKRCEEVPGYTKLKDDGWSYSDQTVSAVAEFLQKFPSLFDKIRAQDGMDSLYQEDLFPEDSAIKMSDVTKYLKSLPCSNIKPMKAGAEILDDNIVKAIEADVVHAMKKNRSKHMKKVKMQVKPHLLYRPLAAQGSLIPDPPATYWVYDRVVNVCQGHSVPFGLRGTVVGVHTAEKELDTMYDILFDKTFIGGISIRSSEERGYRLPPVALINISYGERKENEKNGITVKKPMSACYSQQDGSRKSREQGQSWRRDEQGFNSRQQPNQTSGFSTQRSTRPDAENSNYNNNRQGYDRQNRQQQDGGYYDRQNRQQQDGGYYDRQNRQQQDTGYSRTDRQSQQPGSIYNNWNSTQDYQHNQYNLKQAQERESSTKRFEEAKGSSPKFVTPKVPKSQNFSRLEGNSEFANMWKELQSSGNSFTFESSPSAAKQTSLRPNTSEPSLKDAAKALGHMHMSPPSAKTLSTHATRPRSLSREDPPRSLPAPLPPRESTSPVATKANKEKKSEQDKNVSNADTENTKTKISLEELFSKAADKSHLMKSVPTEETSLCDQLVDLEIQEDSTQLSVSPIVKEGVSPVGSLQDCSQALKNMLNILDKGEQEAVPVEPAPNPRSYGRQVSVQELFDGAKQSTEGSTVVRKVSPKQPTLADTLQQQAKEKPTSLQPTAVEVAAPKSPSQLHPSQSNTSHATMPVSPPRPQIPSQTSLRQPLSTAPPVQHSVPPVQQSVPPVQQSVPPAQHSVPPSQHSVPPVQHSVPPVQHSGTNMQPMQTAPPSTFRARGQFPQQQQRWQLPPGRGQPFQFPNNGTPRMELFNWCQSHGFKPPEYEFMYQQGNHYSFVMLQNGARFQGSLCSTHDDAAESAASNALLQLAMHARFVTPLSVPRYRGGNPTMDPRQFWSPNSAFRPVAQQEVDMRGVRPMTGQQLHGFTQQVMGHPNLQNVHLQQGYQQQQQLQGYPQQLQMRATGNPGDPRPATMPSHDGGASINPFIPLQVSRQQKTPQKKAEKVEDDKPYQDRPPPEQTPAVLPSDLKGAAPIPHTIHAGSTNATTTEQRTHSDQTANNKESPRSREKTSKDKSADSNVKTAQKSTPRTRQRLAAKFSLTE